MLSSIFCGEVLCGAEKNIFGIIWRTRFLSVRGVVEDVNSVMYVRSNDVGFDEGFFCMVEVILVAEGLVD